MTFCVPPALRQVLLISQFTAKRGKWTVEVIQLHWRCATGFLAQLIDMGGPASTTPGHLLEGVVSVGTVTPLDAIEGQRDLAFESNGPSESAPFAKFAFNFGFPAW